MSSTVSPVSVRSAVTVQRASSLDHSRPHDAMAEADVSVDAALARRVAHVVQDRGPVRDRLGVRPRAERVAEGEHVGVRTDAGVAEEVPGPADGVARLEDRVRLARQLVLEVVRRADPGQAGTDDQDIEMVAGHESGEGGIRTHEAAFTAHAISSRAP